MLAHCRAPQAPAMVEQNDSAARGAHVIADCVGLRRQRYGKQLAGGREMEETRMIHDGLSWKKSWTTAAARDAIRGHVF